MPTISRPFPGMNPYLEKLWPDFHTSLLVYMSNALQPGLPDGLAARIEEDPALDLIHHDPFRVHRSEALIAPRDDEAGSALSIDEVTPVAPDIYRVLETVTPRWIEIVDFRRGDAVVTAIELLSPVNKGAGPLAYREKCHGYRQAGINLVEIDFLRSGEHAVSIPERFIPKRKRSPYIVCATRADEPRTFRVWHIALWQRLPAITVPLRPSDPDGVIDLQSLIDTAREHGRYDQQIDYQKPLDPPLPQEILARIEEYSRAANRKDYNENSTE